MQKPILLAFCAIMLLRTGYSQASHSFLQKSLNALDNVKAATYYFSESVAPSIDTSKVKTYHRFFREIQNPADATIGSTFAWFQSSDTTKMEFFYNGASKGYVNWNTKSISIDSFYTNLKPFRAVGPPFSNYTRSIIAYALQTKDSILIRTSDVGESIVFRLTIYDQVVEFFGNNLYYTDSNALPYIDDPDNVHSEYTIWIRKSDNLPFRFKRKMPHNVSFGEYKEAKIASRNLSFDPKKHFPPDFTIKSLNQQERVLEHDQKLLVGKVAPAFSLEGPFGESRNLLAVRGKVVILNFAGIGCGPCHASLGFLKNLARSPSGDIELISVESWKTNEEGIKKYKSTNGLTFSIVAADTKILKDYVISSVPTFFILDRKGVVRKIVSGYTKSITDAEIMNEISKLLAD